MASSHLLFFLFAAGVLRAKYQHLSSWVSSALHKRSSVKALVYQNTQPPRGVPQRQRRQGPANRIHTQQLHAPGIGPPWLHGAGLPPQATPPASSIFFAQPLTVLNVPTHRQRVLGASHAAPSSAAPIPILSSFGWGSMSLAFIQSPNALFLTNGNILTGQEDPEFKLGPPFKPVGGVQHVWASSHRDKEIHGC